MSKAHTQHSEGPFSFEEDHDVDQGHFDIRDADGVCIAQVINDYADHDCAMAYWTSDGCTMEADARLFAASWDMLEALQAIANGEGVYGAQAHEYKQIARKAIAKATGGDA